MSDDVEQPPRGYNTDDVAAQPDATRSRWKSRLKLALALIIIVPILLGALYTWSTLHFAYATGAKTGYVQKFSKEGWLCKTWEGELAMTPVPGAAPEIFYFTVRDEAVVKRIKDAEGKKVALYYKEKRGIPSSCFGDTHHFINDVRALGP